MKPGKTTFKPGDGGFLPQVEVGADDRGVWVLLGPVRVRLTVPTPGESDNVLLMVDGDVTMLDPTEATTCVGAILTPSAGAAAQWARSLKWEQERAEWNR